MNKKSYTVAERFMEYVKIDTQSDPTSEHYPSTSKQLNLTRKLKQELELMGAADIALDEFGYLIARVPGNILHKVPPIFFCAHVDTTPDCSGTDVEPLVRYNYSGEDLHYPDDAGIVLSPDEHPNLKQKIGHDIITASGKTLLGADDKAGVAIIMEVFEKLLHSTNISHGDIYLLITPDEEIGKGVAHLDVEKLPADFGYTLDGGDLGHLNNENFSADGLELKIFGRTAHPGYARGKMENAIKIISEIISALPKDRLTPEVAGEDDGFIHPTNIEGTLAEAKANFILRDFSTDMLTTYADIIQETTEKVLETYPHTTFKISQHKQYRNMNDILRTMPHIFDLAVKATKAAGIDPVINKIRGGTDGALLTFMGKPCPNIFAGQQAIHSKLEWISIQDMEKAAETVLNICRLNAVNEL